MTRAIPAPGKAFIDQHRAQRTAIAHKNPQVAAIAVGIAVACRCNFKRPIIDERIKPRSCTPPQRQFGGATRIVNFGRIDIGHPDAPAPIADGVAIDHAIGLKMSGAERELRLNFHTAWM